MIVSKPRAATRTLAKPVHEPVAHGVELLHEAPGVLPPSQIRPAPVVVARVELRASGSGLEASAPPPVSAKRHSQAAIAFVRVMSILLHGVSGGARGDSLRRPRDT